MLTNSLQEEALLEAITVTTISPFRAKDRTNAERQRRYRAKRRAVTVTEAERNGVTVDTLPERNGVTIATWEMCSLAARLTDGRATAEDLQLAERLLLHLVLMLQRDSSIEVIWGRPGEPGGAGLARRSWGAEPGGG
jgi:hypothetical protein